MRLQKSKIWKAIITQWQIAVSMYVCICIYVCCHCLATEGHGQTNCLHQNYEVFHSIKTYAVAREPADEWPKDVGW